MEQDGPWWNSMDQLGDLSNTKTLTIKPSKMYNGGEVCIIKKPHHNRGSQRGSS